MYFVIQGILDSGGNVNKTNFVEHGRAVFILEDSESKSGFILIVRQMTGKEIIALEKNLKRKEQKK